MTQQIELLDDVPFSLMCASCSADGPGSYDEALTEGWQRIAYTPESPHCNFVGLCADCASGRRKGEKKPRKRQDVNRHGC